MKNNYNINNIKKLYRNQKKILINILKENKNNFYNLKKNQLNN